MRKGLILVIKFIFIYLTAYGQVDTVFRMDLLSDTAFACCNVYAKVFPNMEVDSLNWSNGEKTDTIYASGPDTLSLFAWISSDTVLYDSIVIIGCDAPKLTKYYLCSSNLPLNLAELGLDQGEALWLNGQSVSEISPNLYPENKNLTAIIQYSCGAVCHDCEVEDSLFIVSDNIISFTIGGVVESEYSICSNADSNLIIQANYFPGLFDCSTCIGNTTPSTFTLDPKLCQPGNHIIKYITEVYSCPVSSQMDINILSPTPVEILSPDSNFICLNDTLIVFNITPSGGVYTINDKVIPAGILNPSKLNNNIDSLTLRYYLVDDGQGCIVEATETYDLRQPPLVGFVPLDESYCQNDPNVTLFGIPLGGVYILDNEQIINGNLLDFHTILPGDHTLTYRASDGFCSEESLQQFEIKTVPTVIIYNTDTLICTNDHPLTIITNRPDGSFYPEKFNSGVINPVLTDIGSNLIIYQVEENGCIGVDEKNFIVIPIPILLLQDPVYTCEPYTKTMFNFSTSLFDFSSKWMFPDGEYQDDRVYFNHDFITSGQKEVKLEVTDEYGCIADTIFYTDIPPVNQSFILLSDSISQTQEPITFTSGSSSPLLSTLWLFGDGASSSDSISQHEYHNEGVYTILLSTIDKFGCSDTAEAKTLIKDPLDVHFSVINLFPNPTSGILQGEIYTPVYSVIEIEVYSIDGILRRTFCLESGVLLNPGRHSFSINIEDLPQGIYVLQFNNGVDSLNGPYYYDHSELIYESLDHLPYLKVIKF